MKKTPLFISALSLVIGFSSCQQNTKEKEAELQKTVIDAHDKVMVQMDAITENTRQLDTLKAKFPLLKEKNNIDTNLLAYTIDSLKKELAAADDAMMTWMHNFNPDYTGKTHNEIINYLNDQKVAIDSVETLFNNSLNKSQEIISKHQ